MASPYYEEFSSAKCKECSCKTRKKFSSLKIIRYPPPLTATPPPPRPTRPTNQPPSHPPRSPYFAIEFSFFSLFYFFFDLFFLRFIRSFIFLLFFLFSFILSVKSIRFHVIVVSVRRVARRWEYFFVSFLLSWSRNCNRRRSIDNPYLVSSVFVLLKFRVLQKTKKKKKKNVNCGVDLMILFFKKKKEKQ